MIDDINRISNGIVNDPIQDSTNETIKIFSNLEILKGKAKERYIENEKIIKDSFQRIQIADKLLLDANRYSKEIGLDVNKMPNYTGLLDNKKKLEEKIKSLTNYQNKYKGLI